MVSEKTGDYAKVMALIIGILFGVIFLVNAIAPQVFISMGQILFALLMVLGVYIITKLFRLEQTDKIDLESIVIYGAAIFAIVALLLYFPDISPLATVKVQGLMSIVGVGG